MQLERVLNFRDLGGFHTNDGRRVRTGRIYRSGQLARATDNDLDTLTGLGIRLVIDFRGPGDVAAEGEDRLPAGAEHVQLPMFDPSGQNDLRTLMASGDTDVLIERFGDGRAFELMRTLAA